jgi:hypothetical protein
MYQREDPVREERITMQIVVDTYTREESATGWYCYLENNMVFPFRANLERINRSTGETVLREAQIIGLSDSDECMSHMRVIIVRKGEEYDVALSRVHPIDATPKTAEAIADWHYWVGRGYSFC